MINMEICRISAALEEALRPEQIWLFGDFAESAGGPQSIYQFYIVTPGQGEKIGDLYDQARAVLPQGLSQEVDITIGSLGTFHESQSFPSLEKDVAENGLLIYNRKSDVDNLTAYTETGNEKFPGMGGFGEGFAGNYGDEPEPDTDDDDDDLARVKAQREKDVIPFDFDRFVKENNSRGASAEDIQTMLRKQLESLQSFGDMVDHAADKVKEALESENETE